MRKKKENRAEKQDASNHSQKEEKKLMEQHPFETESQVQNRYGHGRPKSGSDGSHQDGRGSNH